MRHELELRSGRIPLDNLTRNILDGRSLPLIFMLTAPNAVAFTIQAFVNIAEIWLIGTLGTVALAAIALSFPFSILIQTHVFRGARRRCLVCSCTCVG